MFTQSKIFAGKCFKGRKRIILSWFLALLYSNPFDRKILSERIPILTGKYFFLAKISDRVTSYIIFSPEITCWGANLLWLKIPTKNTYLVRQIRFISVTVFNEKWFFTSKIAEYNKKFYECENRFPIGSLILNWPLWPGDKNRNS